MEKNQIEEIEINLLLDALYLRYGYDFRDYDRGALKKRIHACLSQCTFHHVSEIIPRLLHHGEFLTRLVHALSINTTAMFRDPQTFAILRTTVFPVLASFPFINIWHAGCATGEEVYSLAILLHEAKLLRNARIYATDLDDEALSKAREGVYPFERLEEFEEGYRQAGGVHSLRDYCTLGYGLFRFEDWLRQNMIFANHNLVTDGVFAEIHLLLCRNVLIYFNPELRERALGLFRDSLGRGGFLCLGGSEYLPRPGWEHCFQTLAMKERIFRKIPLL
ncbi:MAG: protein-glutamate O-methyltransferase CheR [Magnetococcales bacterium]|nr:protein-glutamate O-methyltransferase CheR [Magnetococcales bacterium]